jgi:hypothetical protein
VRLTPEWKEVPRQLAELGYDKPEDPSLARAVPDAPRRTRKTVTKRRAAGAKRHDDGAKRRDGGAKRRATKGSRRS